MDKGFSHKLNKRQQLLKVFEIFQVKNEDKMRTSFKRVEGIDYVLNGFEISRIMHSSYSQFVLDGFILFTAGKNCFTLHSYLPWM